MSSGEARTRFGSAGELSARLGASGYLADESLATIVYLALEMQRPLLVEGEPGIGKTALAEAVAAALDVPLVRLQCYEGIDATRRSTTGTSRGRSCTCGPSRRPARPSTWTRPSRRSSRAVPALAPGAAALREAPAVLLVDEIDRADDEFEAFLLEVLSTYQVTIPEVGVITAVTPPVVVLTSNRTRELHDALRRRCLYHWIDHPDLAREVEIVRTRAPEVPAQLAAQVVGLVQRLRNDESLLKPPGVAETLDWARALHRLGTTELDIATASATLGAVVKYREDAQRVRLALDRMLAS